MTSAITAYLSATLNIKQHERRRMIAHTRLELAAIENEIATIKRLMAAIRADRLDEAGSAEQIAKRNERDRKRQASINDRHASAQRRLGALRDRKAAGKPTSPMTPDKARKEAERVRKIDQRAADIRASTGAKAARERSKLGS